MKRKQLAIKLSKLKGFEKPRPKLEQYRTPGEVAATILWMIRNDLKDATILDLGSGTGVLSIGASLLGARKVYSVEVDERAAEIQGENVEELGLENVEIMVKDVEELDPPNADLVLMNPPFGVQKKHADKPFLKKAFQTKAPTYTIQKVESKEFLESFSEKNGYQSELVTTFKYRLPRTQPYHEKRIHEFKAGLFKLVPAQSS